MYQARLLEVGLSLEVPLALSRHSLEPAFNLSLLHQVIFFLPSPGICEKFILRVKRNVLWPAIVSVPL